MKQFNVFLLCLTIILFAFPIFAQQYVIEWADTIDNDNWDYGLGIAIDNNGNVYVAGYYYVGSNDNCLTIKYDSLGNIIWADTVDNGNTERAYGVAVDNNGNIYITGYSYNGSNWDCLTIKYDSLGSIIWADIVDNGSAERAYGVAVDNNGNVYITGYSYNGSDYDYLTIKYDSLGSIMWTDTVDNGSDDYSFGIAVNNNGNVYITGYSYIGSSYDYLTIKYDSLGSIIWADTVDVGIFSRGNDIVVDSSNVYVTGYYYNGSNDNYLTIKYDSLGSIMWADTFDNGGLDRAYGIAVDNNGNVYITGYSDTGSNYDYLTIKYDSLGSIMWTDTVDNGYDDYAYGIAVDNNEKIYITGYFHNGLNTDYLTIKYVKNEDIGILYIVSPDTVEVDSIYIPQVWVKNNSYEYTYTFDICAFIDSAGTNIYADTQNIVNLIAGDSVLVSFSQWTAPSIPVDLNLSFSIFINDVNAENDTISKTLYVKDLIFPVIDSAIAYDGTNLINGVDDDDYVRIFFSEPTNKALINATNIYDVLLLSSEHTWLDGYFAIDTCLWSPNGTELIVYFSTNGFPPTIAVGDTITPDGVTITDIYGNACSSSIILSGAFGPSGLVNKDTQSKMFLNVSSINNGKILFSYGIKDNSDYEMNIYTTDGKVIRKIKGKDRGYYKEKITGLPSGIYFLKLKQGKETISKKVILIK